MLTIFHSARTRSQRVVWLCEEMGLPYEVRVEQFANPSADFLAANPLKAFPALKDGDVCMIESVAIMLYLMSKYGPTAIDLKPTERDYAKYMQFLVFGEAGLAMYGNPMIMTKFMAPEAERTNWTVDYLKTTIGKRMDFVEAALGDADYIAGDRFSAADISVGYSVGMAGFAAGIEPSPKLQAYVERLRARPAYERAAAA